MFSFLSKKKGIEVKAPVRGQIFPLEKVSDPVFSQKMMGDGIAIQYHGGDVYAPISGTISVVVLPSMHAFGIQSEDGAEILVHVGLETVNLKGEGFRLLKHQGDHVNAGEKILEVDIEVLKEKQIDLVTPIIVTNSDCFELEVKAFDSDEVRAKETILFTLHKR